MKYTIVNELLKKELTTGILKDSLIMVPETAGANSVDLRACIESKIVLEPGEQVLVPCGIAVAIPMNTMGAILPRSGKGSKGLVLGNLVGNVDPDYRGEVKACLWNRTTDTTHTIEPFERIAQFVVVDCYSPANWEIVEDLDETERGSGGFGSTDSK